MELLCTHGHKIQFGLFTIYLTNNTYGLGVPEEHIDKYKFFQVAQFCDACDSVTGKFIGVDGLADGTFRHKPRVILQRYREIS